MEKELSIALICGLAAMIGWGTADFFAKKTIDKIGDITTLFWQQFVGIFALILVFLVSPIFPDLNITDVLIMVVLGAWSGLSYLPAYTAFGKGKLSLISPIFASYAAVVAILSTIFLHELLPFNKVIALVVVFIGLFIVNGDPRDFLSLLKGKTKENTKGFPEIFLAVVTYSVWLILLDQFLSGKYWVPYLLGIRIFSTITLFIFSKFTKKELSFKDRSLWKYLIAIGIFDVAAFSFVSFGYSSTHYVSIITMLSAAFSLPTILLAGVFLKEKVTLAQRLGSFVIILGIVVLSLI